MPHATLRWIPSTPRCDRRLILVARRRKIRVKTRRVARDLPPFLSEREVELKPLAFFGANPVFRFDEFAQAYLDAGHSERAITAVLGYHVRTGRLQRVRRGLYATAVGGFDPFVIGSKLTK